MHTLGHEEVKVRRRVAQVGYLNGIARLGFVVLIQDPVHNVRIRSHLDCVESDAHSGYFSNLVFNLAAIGITLRIVIKATSMILITVSGCISQQYSKFACCLPVLLDSVVKAASHVLWAIVSTKGIKLLKEFGSSLNFIAKWKYFGNILAIGVITVGNN